MQFIKCHFILLILRAFQSVDISSSNNVFGPEEYNLKAPISNPEKILCVGMNYVDHCTEQNVPVPTEPIIFSKFGSAITDPCAPVVKPDETEVDTVWLVIFMGFKFSLILLGRLIHEKLLNCILILSSISMSHKYELTESS